MFIRDVLKLISDDVLVHIFAERDDGSAFEVYKDPCYVVRADDGEFQNLEVLCIGTMKSIEMLRNKKLRTNADIYIIGRLQEANAAKGEA